ncbi:MAG TPA: hypothetical protein VK142_02275 [Bacillota bacterium]|nr:hypothetical protein [Bacillota bacterium]
MANQIPKSAIKGTANGVLFMAFFGLAWAGIGIGGLDGWGNPWLPIISVSISIILFILGLGLFRAANNFPAYTGESNIQREKKIGIGFGITVVAEFVLIGAAGVFLNAIDQFEYFFPVMALIVGVHFFPLAYLFQVRAHYIAGILLCLFAIMTLFWLPPRFIISHFDIDVWSVFIGFTSSITLWATGMAIWISGKRLVKNA